MPAGRAAVDQLEAISSTVTRPIVPASHGGIPISRHRYGKALEGVLPGDGHNPRAKRVEIWVELIDRLPHGHEGGVDYVLGQRWVGDDRNRDGEGRWAVSIE